MGRSTPASTPTRRRCSSQAPTRGERAVARVYLGLPPRLVEFSWTFASALAFNKPASSAWRKVGNAILITLHAPRSAEKRSSWRLLLSTKSAPAPDHGLVRRRRHGRGTSRARRSLSHASPSSADAPTGRTRGLAVRGGVDLVAHVGIHALASWGRSPDGQHRPLYFRWGRRGWESIIVSFLRRFWAFCVCCARCVVGRYLRAPRAFRVLIQICDLGLQGA